MGYDFYLLIAMHLNNADVCKLYVGADFLWPCVGFTVDHRLIIELNFVQFNK